MILQKAIDSNQNSYFAFHIIKDSQEMERIRSCPGRYWNKTHKVWLMPYSDQNWSIIKERFLGIKYNISTDILTLTPQEAKPIAPQNQKPNVIKYDLTPAQQDALAKMKEHLIVKRYQESTLKTYLSSFADFLSYHREKNPIEITIDDIKKFMLNKINNAKISESTQNGLVNAIKFYYEKIEGRPQFYVTDLRPRRPKKLPGFLSKEDTKKLLNATQNIKHRVILQLIYSAGLRLGELTKLKIRDVKFDLGIIEVKCAKGKKDRITILSTKVKKLLLEYIDTYKPKFYLFEGQTGGKYSDRSVQNILTQAVIKSGVDENTTVHTLRHTFATHMILNGVDLRRVQEYLGHSSPETTAIYTHITDKMKSDVKSPLDDLDL